MDLFSPHLNHEKFQILSNHGESHFSPIMTYIQLKVGIRKVIYHSSNQGYALRPTADPEMYLILVQANIFSARPSSAKLMPTLQSWTEAGLSNTSVHYRVCGGSQRIPLAPICPSAINFDCF